jgi:hypothetical protein
MFTLFLNLNASTFSPSRLCLLQFATAVACVKAVKEDHQVFLTVIGSA